MTVTVTEPQRAMTGAERIAAYRQRKREAGFVEAWTEPGREELPKLDHRDPQNIVDHWNAALRQLQAVQKAARQRAEMRGLRQTDLDEQVSFIADEDLRKLRLTRRPREPWASKAARWQAGCDQIREVVGEYQTWLDSLPAAIEMAGGATVTALQEAILQGEAALDTLEGVDHPQAFAGG